MASNETTKKHLRKENERRTQLPRRPVMILTIAVASLVLAGAALIFWEASVKQVFSAPATTASLDTTVNNAIILISVITSGLLLLLTFNLYRETKRAVDVAANSLSHMATQAESSIKSAEASIRSAEAATLAADVAKSTLALTETQVEEIQREAMANDAKLRRDYAPFIELGPPRIFVTERVKCGYLREGGSHWKYGNVNEEVTNSLYIDRFVPIDAPFEVRSTVSEDGIPTVLKTIIKEDEYLLAAAFRLEIPIRNIGNGPACQVKVTKAKVFSWGLFDLSQYKGALVEGNLFMLEPWNQTVDQILRLAFANDLPIDTGLASHSFDPFSQADYSNEDGLALIRRSWPLLTIGESEQLLAIHVAPRLRFGGPGIGGTNLAKRWSHTIRPFSELTEYETEYKPINDSLKSDPDSDTQEFFRRQAFPFYRSLERIFDRRYALGMEIQLEYRSLLADKENRHACAYRVYVTEQDVAGGESTVSCELVNLWRDDAVWGALVPRGSTPPDPQVDSRIASALDLSTAYPERFWLESAEIEQKLEQDALNFLKSPGSLIESLSLFPRVSLSSIKQWLEYVLGDQLDAAADCSDLETFNALNRPKKLCLGDGRNHGEETLMFLLRWLGVNELIIWVLTIRTWRGNDLTTFFSSGDAYIRLAHAYKLASEERTERERQLEP
jgi:hypothetical protein